MLSQSLLIYLFLLTGVYFDDFFLLLRRLCLGGRLRIILVLISSPVVRVDAAAKALHYLTVLSIQYPVQHFNVFLVELTGLAPLLRLAHLFDEAEHRDVDLC